MKLEDIRTPVGTLSGIGPAAVKLFSNLNIFTISDLLSFYPRDYDDRTKTTPLKDFRFNSKIHTVAKVTAHDWFGFGRMRTLKIYINDGTAEAQLIAFNRPFLEKSLPVGAIIVVSGTFAVKYNSLQSTSFETIKLSDNIDGNDTLEDYSKSPLPDSGVLPIYSLTEGLSQKIVRKAIASAIKQCAIGIDDELPKRIIEARKLLHKKDAIRLVHQPERYSDVEEARHSLIFEELYHFQYTMAERALEHKGSLPKIDLSSIQNEEASLQIDKQIFISSLSPRQKQLFERLPFSLTDDQIRVIQQMDEDIDKGYKDRCSLLKEDEKSVQKKNVYTMARLLQGDVGSGKTLAAFFACLRCTDWGGQCAIMAPTEILARQHADNAARLLEPMGVRIAFLTGTIQSSGRSQLLKALKNGEIDIVIGTHALFSNGVVYKDLQLVIIDEQHRFGVTQRNAIVGKGLQLSSGRYMSPHLLMMSATPIPQTLALTAFGDLDVSTIRTMPAGRKPITTYLVREGHEQNAYEEVKKELSKGHQAYFVYPAIEGGERDFASEESSKTAIKAAEEMFHILSSQIYPDYLCALLHSKVDEDTQVKVLNDFRDGKIKVLVATTVIEVGVDVPNATCMVIEQADRFGLAQLHQLRGRVGRGESQSYCFLIYSKNITQTGIARMKALRQSTDGFVIAEDDLKLRGPGELTGTIQAGNLTLGIADLSRDHDILLQARADAFSTMQHKMQGGSSE